jgi:type IV conjugative transfer system lipoprotein TraV
MRRFFCQFTQSLVLASFLLLLGTSCSSTQSSWTCPTPEGGKGSCVSIKEADLSESSSSSPERPNFNYLDSAQKIEINLVAPRLSELKKLQAEKNLLNAEFKAPGVRLRSEEKIGKIWFAPHIDSQGNQHSEAVVYVVDEEPRWISSAVSQNVSVTASTASSTAPSSISEGISPNSAASDFFAEFNAEARSND